MILHADQQVEILDALEIIRELKLKGVISGGAEAWKVADAIKQANVPVVVGGTLNLPRHDHDPYDSAYANPAKLHAAGVSVAIQTNRRGSTSETAARNLPFEAASAVAFGLPEEVALKAVTLTPSQILGVADQVGSLEAGKRANLVVTAGHLLQPTTPVLALFIDGEPLRPESRHTRLYAKFRHRLDEVLRRPCPPRNRTNAHQSHGRGLDVTLAHPGRAAIESIGITIGLRRYTAWLVTGPPLFFADDHVLVDCPAGSVEETRCSTGSGRRRCVAKTGPRWSK